MKSESDVFDCIELGGYFILRSRLRSDFGFDEPHIVYIREPLER